MNTQDSKDTSASSPAATPPAPTPADAGAAAGAGRARRLGLVSLGLLVLLGGLAYTGH